MTAIIPTWALVLTGILLLPWALRTVLRIGSALLLGILWTVAITVAIVWGIFRLFRRTPPRALTTVEARLMMKQQEIRDLRSRMN